MPESTVIVAYEGAQLVGTITLTLDSPANLPLAKDYPEELAKLRKPNRVLVEFGSLAIVKRLWHSGLNNLLSMAAVYVAHNIQKATHIVMGINPKAASFYRAVYGFQKLGGKKGHNELIAPVLAMQVNLCHLRSHLKRHFKKPLSSKFFPHEHFFDSLPLCIDIPAIASREELVRWKLSREVFQELFMVRTDRLQTLSEEAKRYIGHIRSENTLMGLLN